MPRFYDPSEPSAGYVSPNRQQQQPLPISNNEDDNGATVFDNLYQKGLISMATREVVSQEVVAARAAQSEEAELKECTFRPVTHSGPSSRPHKYAAVSNAPKKSIFERLGVDEVNRKRITDAKNAEKLQKRLALEREPELRAERVRKQGRTAPSPPQNNGSNGVPIFDELYKQGVKAHRERKEGIAPGGAAKGRKMCPFKPLANATEEEKRRREALSQASREREDPAYLERRRNEERVMSDRLKKKEQHEKFERKFEALKPKHSRAEDLDAHKKRLNTPSAEPFSCGCPIGRSRSRSRDARRSASAAVMDDEEEVSQEQQPSQQEAEENENVGGSAEAPESNHPQQKEQQPQSNGGSEEEPKPKGKARGGVTSASPDLLRPTVSSNSRTSSRERRRAPPPKVRGLPKRPPPKSGTTSHGNKQPSASPDPTSPPRHHAQDDALTIDELY